MNLETQLKEGEQTLARIWKLTALRGALAIAFAVVILIWPNIGLSALIVLFGALALVSGLTTIVEAFRLPIRGGERAWLVFEGLLGVAVGVVVFIWPDLSALGLLYAIAAWAIALGMFEIGLAFVLPISGGRKLLAMLGGVLSIAFGVIMFGHPGAGAVALLALVAAFALVTGVMQIAFALELRRAVGELEQRIQPHTTAKPVTQG
ncbi:MAG: HdeD family acid-resistance protein [Gaiellaceae bacterium]